MARAAAGEVAEDSVLGVRMGGTEEGGDEIVPDSVVGKDAVAEEEEGGVRVCGAL